MLTDYWSTDRHIQIDRNTDKFAKTIFSCSVGLKTWRFEKNREGGQILHKSNTFSYENVKSEASVLMLKSYKGVG